MPPYSLTLSRMTTPYTLPPITPGQQITIAQIYPTRVIFAALPYSETALNPQAITNYPNNSKLHPAR